MTDLAHIRPAVKKDLQSLRNMLPQLADFEVPDRRDPRDLWRGDLLLIETVLSGKAPDSFADVAVDGDDEVIGLILVTLRDELMSHSSSAHLEAIVVDPRARGTGLGRRLLAHAEDSARKRGARSLTLHVFSNNHRARALYDRQGYDSELIRAIKWFD